MRILQPLISSQSDFQQSAQASRTEAEVVSGTLCSTGPSEVPEELGQKSCDQQEIEYIQ